jgi:hypothetical protein
MRQNPYAHFYAPQIHNMLKRKYYKYKDTAATVIAASAVIMVDPVTIASAAQSAITLAKLCFRISQNISRIQRVDTTVLALGKEIDGLKSILDRVREIGNVSSESLAGPGKQHLESIQYSLVECRETLEKMDPIFRNLNNIRRPIFRPWKSIKYDWKTEEIAQFRHEVEVCQNQIALDLMMITWYYCIAAKR